jgi:DNA replication protein DnaC
MAISYRAIQYDFTAKFATAAGLIGELSAAGRQGKLSQALKAYTSPSVLVIDEVGYLTYGPDAANVLFHVVNDRYIARRPILFTTNKSPFSEWGDALHDKDLAEAIVDRVLERGRLILLDGPSARTQHIVQPDAQGKVDKVAIISGTNRPEFPESTA